MPEVIGKDGQVSYEILCKGQGDCRITIVDEEGQAVAEGQGFQGKLHIKDVKLWQPGKAYLYKAVVNFGEDLYEESFGVRTVEVKGTSS